MREKNRGLEQQDLLARLLEFGLGAVLLLAPLPFGSVIPTGRLALEIGACFLVLIWILRAACRRAELPPRAVWWGLVGLLALASIQAIPLPSSALYCLGFRASEIVRSSEPPLLIREAEAALVGVNVEHFAAPGTISVDPGSTASALRTGAALTGLMLVAITVAASRGVNRLALVLIVSAAFQGLYGLLVLVSGHDRIWHVPKRYGLDSATGTFVNRNHYACLLAISLACGTALILHYARRNRSNGRRHRIVRWLSPSGSRTLLLGVLLIVGLAGLLLSFSRAGIAVGMVALALTVLRAGQFQTTRARLIIVTLVVVLAFLPLLQVGTDRLVDRFERTAEDLNYEGGRATVWLDTLRVTEAFPVFGTGYGTFAEVYPLFRSAEVRRFYQHAHNDFLQALAEGGVLGAVCLLVLALPILMAVVAGLRGSKGTLGVGFAAGLLAVLLHSIVDFPFHIPAIAATATIVAGSLLGLPCSDQT